MREGLSEAKADRWAVRLGRLAYEVWPEMVDEAIAELEQECAAPDCTERFVAPPKAWNKRYCSSRCCSRESMRAFRRTRKGREANRRYRREVMELRRRREMS
jgi:predicted sulfurtransferase